MIVSFADKQTEVLFNGRNSGRLPHDVCARVVRKLDLINAAHSEADLRIPPGNRFEHLSGDKQGFCSIRVNQQWRIVFQFNNGEASKVHLSKHYEN
jgi:proteic killer suppression protein